MCKSASALLVAILSLSTMTVARAQTIVDDNFARANTALGTVTGPSGAAGQVYYSPSTGAPYNDAKGNLYQISSGTLVGSPPAAGVQGNMLLRPIAENFKQGGIRVYFTYTAGRYLELHLHDQPGGDGLYCYLGSSGQIGVGWHNSGGNSSPAFLNVTLTSGTGYILDFSSDNSAASSLTATLSAQTAPSTAIGVVGPVVVSGAAADTNTGGQAGLNEAQNYSIDTVTRLITYQGSGPGSGAATGYTSAESATSGGAGTPVTLTYTSSGAATATVTPSVSGVSGTFSPAVVTLSGASPVTTVFTPSTIGIANFSSTNNGGLTDPPALTYTVTAPLITIPVSSSAFRFSPGNWVGDTGRSSGSAYRQTWNPGAYFTATWTTTSASPTANVLFDETGLNTNAQLSYFIDGTLTDNVGLPSASGQGSLAVSGLAGAGTHTLTCYVVSSAQVNRWGSGNTNVVRVTGLQVDGGGAAGTAPALTGWVMLVGTSIWEGIGVGDWLYDTSAALGFGLRQSQGWDFCESNCGGNGWLATGDNNNDVPGWYSVSGGVYTETASRWDKIDATHTLLDSAGQITAYGQTGTLPSAIVTELLANESLRGYSKPDTTASVTGWLTALHQGSTPAAPGVPVFILVSPGMYNPTVYGNGVSYIAALKAGIANYKAAYPSDTKVALIDLGPGVSNALASTAFGAGVHYNQAGHQYVAPLILASLQKGLASPSIPSLLYQSRQPSRGR